ncbi:hypothetical protein [Cumulibacter manganitolerans]|uniref:hypothetical protein n=1 Tax=Cumulibacter manganitolerans TaxID=1884992 RepID=UPI0012974996|nr:hypothetical protein [Cumulibacter manganitolerans]
MFGPMSTFTAVLCGVASLMTTIVTVRTWDRPGRARFLRHTAGVTVGFVLLGIAMFVLLNQQLGFYAQWREIGGGW